MLKLLFINFLIIISKKELCFDVVFIENDECNCNTSLGNVWKDCYLRMKNSSENCTFDKKLKFFEKTVLEKCKDYCPLECDTTTYAVSNNFARREPYTTITVYYRSLKYTSITQEPKMRQFDMVRKKQIITNY